MGSESDEEIGEKLKVDPSEEREIKKHNLTDAEYYGYGWRHIVTMLTFFGFAVIFALRVNLGVAIVPMVNQTAVRLLSQKNESDEGVEPLCYGHGNATGIDTQEGPFVWNERLQGLVLASFFYGYIVTQIPGGILAGLIGAKWVFGLGTLWTAVLTLLSPMAAELGAGYLIALRVLEGIGEGVTWPATQALFAKWAPPSERSQLPSFAASGCHFGTIFAFLFSGVLAESNFLGGWPSIFYVFGFLGCVWFVLWAIFVESTPESHRWISTEERNYIMHAVKADGTRPSYMDIQWTSVLISVPFWAAMWSHFTFNWCLYVMLTGLPKYFKEVLGFDTKANGAASALPYLCQGIVQIVAGKVADTMRTRFKVRTTIVRKVFDCSGHLLPAIFMVAVGYAGCDAIGAVALLTTAAATSGLISGGYVFNFLDLAPHFSSVLYGISNTIATIPGIIGPSVTGALIEGAYGQDAIYAWRNVFYIAAGFYLSSVVFYALFASGDVQPWAKSGRRSS